MLSGAFEKTESSRFVRVVSGGVITPVIAGNLSRVDPRPKELLDLMAKFERENDPLCPLLVRSTDHDTPLRRNNVVYTSASCQISSNHMSISKESYQYFRLKFTDNEGRGSGGE